MKQNRNKKDIEKLKEEIHGEREREILDRF